MRNTRGAVLVIVMVAAVLCSAIAYGSLYLAFSQERRAEALRQRAQARYAAEAATVWVQQQLWQNPNWSAAPGTPVALGIPGVSQITVTFPACGVPPCAPRQLIVTASN